MDKFQVLPHILALAGAYALALPIGWDREKEARSAGLRTFPLVARAVNRAAVLENRSATDEADSGDEALDNARRSLGRPSPMASCGFVQATETFLVNSYGELAPPPNIMPLIWRFAQLRSVGLPHAHRRCFP